MKKHLEFGMTVAVMALMAGSCAKNTATGVNELAKNYYDAWMEINFPDAKPTDLGYYVIEENEGTGELVGDVDNAPYLYGNYTQRSLDWTISYTGDRTLAKQLGSFDTSYYYGNSVWYRGDDNLPVALDDAMSTMRVGGKKRVVVPSWLMGYTRYSSNSEYIKHSVDGDPAIYDIEIAEIIPDVEAWEIDSLARWMERNYPGVDSTSYGFYYIQTQAPTDTENFDTDDEVYINYIGRLLNGQVFDCTIQDTAKKYNIYSSSSTYEEVYVTWDTTAHYEITMGEDESSLVTGFTQALFNMRTGEKGRAVFYSGLGYSSSSSGNRIPQYSPLIFDLEIVGTEDDDEDDDEDEDEDEDDDE